MTQRRKDSMTQRRKDSKYVTFPGSNIFIKNVPFLQQAGSKQAGASRQQAGRQQASRQPQTVTNSSSNRYLISFAFFLLFLGLVAGNAFCLASGAWGGLSPPTRLGLFDELRTLSFWRGVGHGVILSAIFPSFCS